jgi:hypothetical protein
LLYTLTCDNGPPFLPAETVTTVWSSIAREFGSVEGDYPLASSILRPGPLQQPRAQRAPARAYKTTVHTILRTSEQMFSVEESVSQAVTTGGPLDKRDGEDHYRKIKQMSRKLQLTGHNLVFV